MKVFRTIHPVGHGGFFTEEICEGNECYNMVYDSGTRNGTRLLEREINKVFNRKQSVDLLFISHFDRDHVSGLKELARRNLLNSSAEVVMPFHDAATAVYTGDACLKDLTNGSLPFRCYSALKRVLSKYVHYPAGLFQIPHHGSNSNYDFQL